MKKVYQSPTMRVVKLHTVPLMVVSEVQTNAGMNYGGGSSEIARGRGSDFWDDDDE
jgi:hypothetical protein